MVFDDYAELRTHRSRFLDLAVRDTIKWCVPPDQMAESRKPSDQHWIQLFKTSGDIPVSSADARRFLITFMLIRASWNLEEVAEGINQFSALRPFRPIDAIPSFANELRRMNVLQRQQTSAASKIANFAHPTAAVYIWDALATKSARLRDRERGAKQPRNLGIYKTGGEHDYAAFHAACVLAHDDEKKRADFVDAVAHLDTHFRSQAGPLRDRDSIPTDFIERRLLDKLMFWEGWAIDRKKLPEEL